jgi:hypothetical protein
MLQNKTKQKKTIYVTTLPAQKAKKSLTGFWV